MFNSLKTLSTMALLFCVVIACKESGSRNEMKTLKSPDGKYQLTVPGDWSNRTPKSNEVMGVNNPGETIVLLVSSELKTDLADDITIDKFTETGRNNQLQSAGSDATTPISVNNGNGRQYEITITSQSSKGRCLFTALEGQDQFFRINACTLPSKFDEQKALIKQVSESFRAVSGSDSSPASSP